VDSILNSVKKTLGIDPDLTVYDLDIMMHINSALSTLHQLGVGPANGFAVTDEADSWDEIILDDDPTYNSVKTYVYMKVRMLFDPPATSYLIAAFEKQIEELEWRLNVRRESSAWVDPNPTLP
jgi:hypothetical protein